MAHAYRSGQRLTQHRVEGRKTEERNKKKSDTEASTINITLKNRYGSLQEENTEEKTLTNKRRKDDSRTKDDSQTIELNFSADTEKKKRKIPKRALGKVRHNSRIESWLGCM